MQTRSATPGSLVSYQRPTVTGVETEIPDLGSGLLPKPGTRRRRVHFPETTWRCLVPGNMRHRALNWELGRGWRTPLCFLETVLFPFASAKRTSSAPTHVIGLEWSNVAAADILLVIEKKGCMVAARHSCNGRLSFGGAHLLAITRCPSWRALARPRPASGTSKYVTNMICLESHLTVLEWKLEGQFPGWTKLGCRFE